MSRGKLLIIEDDPGLQSQMRWCFEDCDVFVAGNAKEADAILLKEEPQVVTLDLGLPPDPGGTREGFALLSAIQQQVPQAKVIVVTGREEREHALQAIAKGAYDFYQKPIDSDTLRFVVDRAFRLGELEMENQRLSLLKLETPLEGLITADEQMLALCRQIERVAPTDATITILGETGTGKEIIARNIHRLSQRAERPFVAINCAAIPENLLESELFGHEKGAFTGAIARKTGRIEAADGGTLFLDEIGDMPLALQAKILRFLQERTIERVGGNSNIPVDIRVVCATHYPLVDMTAAATFREDLYFRLSEIVLSLPPLKERSGDAVLLAKSFLQQHTQHLKFSDECLTAIENHNWPGNIRELENKVKRASILADGAFIQPSDMELVPQEDVAPLNLKSARTHAEQEAISRALIRCNNNVSQAARLLGVSRPTLYNLFAKYGIHVEDHQ
jgi:two-component system NtrC family response regulator